jgi:hypothetical protein
MALTDLCLELLREGAGACPEGEGGRGELRQVQVAAPFLQVLRGLQILRQVYIPLVLLNLLAAAFDVLQKSVSWTVCMLRSRLRMYPPLS